MDGDWPMVGRAGELSRLDRLVHSPDSGGVVVAGAAGVGKTRLALECLAEAERVGLASARVRATFSARDIPFGALAPLLPSADVPAAGAVDDRAEMLRRCAAALVERAGDRRLVVFVDDAHLLDEASAALTHQLAEAERVFVLATLRTGEPAPGPVAALWEDGLVERLDLEALSGDAVAELLGAVLGSPVDEGAVAQLTQRSEGNVLFLRELVRGALASGALTEQDGRWCLVAPLQPSDRLVELVEARLAGLAPAARSVIELVALGEPLGSVERDLADAAVVDELERQALLTSRLDGRRLELRLAHPLHGEVVRARLSTLRAKVLARKLADLREATGARRREDVLRVATWRLEGGGPVRPELMLAAAATARWRYDFSAAERLAQAAVTAGAGFDAALLLGQLDYLQGRGEEAEARFAALASQAVNDAQRALVAITRHDNLMYLYRFHDALRVIEDTEAAVTDPAWRDELVAKRLGPTIAMIGVAGVVELSEPLRQRAEGRALVWACLLGALSLARTGRLTEALEASERGYTAHLALALPIEWYPASHLFARAQALVYAGRLAEAEALAAEQYRQALVDRAEERRAWFAWVLAEISLAQGQVARAARSGREGAALLHQLGREPFANIAFGHAVMALALQGRGVAAGQAVAEWDSYGPAVMWLGADHFAARAWAVAATGDLTGACRGLTDAAALAEGAGDRIGMAACLHDLARLGQAEEAAPRLADLVAEVEGELVPTRAAHATALAAGDPEALEASSAAFESMGALLFAAEAAADAAAVWHRKANPRAAEAAEKRAAMLAVRCQGAATPALRAIDVGAVLSSAERKVAVLSAAGRSNRETAERLNLSVGTVESHLRHVYEKLGVSTPADLPDALGPERA